MNVESLVGIQRSLHSLASCSTVLTQKLFDVKRDQSAYSPLRKAVKKFILLNLLKLAQSRLRIFLITLVGVDDASVPRKGCSASS